MSDNQLLNPGVNIKPVINCRESQNLVEKLYGLKCVNIAKLNGYDDINYKIDVDEKHNSNNHVKEICKNGYVLKILNSLESKNPGFIDAQNELMLYLGQKHIACPKPVKNCKGCHYSLEQLESGMHIVRLLEFLPGSILNEISPTNTLYYDIGKYVATVDTILENFHHPAYDSRNFLWMLTNVSKLADFLHVVDIEEDHNIVSEVINQFDSRVLRHLETLEKRIIHGDFNEHNILVNKIDGEWKIAGILDFGDSHRSCYLFELACAMTYMIILGKDLIVAGHVLAGFSSKIILADHELSLLKICVAARLCQSLVIGKYTSTLDPENNYILSSAHAGWKMLRKLWNEPEEELLNKWKAVALFYKS